MNVLLPLGLIMGFVFGFALEKSRVMDPENIMGQFQMRRFVVLKVMLSAIITGLLIMALGTGMGWWGFHIKQAVIGPVLVGGILMGVGMLLAGACPGTAFAQLGAGYRDAIPLLIGALVGAVAYGLVSKSLNAALSMGDWGKATLATLLGLPFPVVAVAMAALFVGVLIAIERHETSGR